MDDKCTNEAHVLKKAAALVMRRKCERLKESEGQLMERMSDNNSSGSLNDDYIFSTSVISGGVMKDINICMNII